MDAFNNRHACYCADSYSCVPRRITGKELKLPSNVMTPLPPHTGVSHRFFIVLRYARCRMRKIRVTV